MAEAGGKKRCAVLAISRGGCALGQRLGTVLAGDLYPCRGRVREIFAQVWQQYEQIVCIMATGIVVRTIAPLLGDKYTDPAVVVCDEQGRFAISLLSGHLGGANELAQRVAAAAGGQAVLTTASDVLGRTALDLWCRDLGLTVASKDDLTRAMGRLVDRGALTLWSRYPLPVLPLDLQPVESRAAADLIIDVCCDVTGHGVLLLPKALVVGLGCNRGTPARAIENAVQETCRQHSLHPDAIAGLASIDLKQDEIGLLEFARQEQLPLHFFSKDQLNEVDGVAASQAVLRATGAKGVAEPAALLSAGVGSILLVSKLKWTDVTTAVAEIADPFAIITQGRQKQ